jgi:hypothetical protein
MALIWHKRRALPPSTTLSRTPRCCYNKDQSTLPPSGGCTNTRRYIRVQGCSGGGEARQVGAWDGRVVGRGLGATLPCLPLPPCSSCVPAVRTHSNQSLEVLGHSGALTQRSSTTTTTKTWPQHLALRSSEWRHGLQPMHSMGTTPGYCMQ